MLLFKVMKDILLETFNHLLQEETLLWQMSLQEKKWNYEIG